MSHNFFRSKLHSELDAAEGTTPTIIRISLYPSEFAWANLTEVERVGLPLYKEDFTFPGTVFDQTGKMVGRLITQ